MTHCSPRIAVALAAYNGLAYLPEQIETIFRQEAVDITLFISVDASVDGTEEWVRAQAQNEPRIVVLPTGQRFGGASANFFHLLREIRLTDFDYLAFADQDDIWSPNKLKRAHLELKANQCDGYSSNVTAFWPSGREKLVHKSSPQKMWDYLFESSGPGCTYLIRRSLALELQRSVLKNSRALSQVVYHDWFTYAYARANGFKWHIDSYSGMLYRQHGNNQLGANSGFSSFKVRVQQVLSGEAIEQARLIAKLVEVSGVQDIKKLLHGGRMEMLRLAILAPQCRRKRLHQVYFFISCLWFACSMPTFHYRD